LTTNIHKKPSLMLAAAPFYATTCGGIIRAELKKG